MNELRILVTGGTFDKVYDPIAEILTFANTHVDEMFRLGRATIDFAIEQLMLKDSLYMTDSDRESILERCRNTLENRILVTHGTGTMVETATVLGNGKVGKTIVLTGAMVPYSFSGSDALYNLAFATCAAVSFPCGVYIAMNARIFNWDNVKKNTETGLFELANTTNS
ncbi:asparaginase [Candidatus Woesearchaeota archaeon]|nr:asparaginase [Candidatus Woesearchaeota archaeon]